MQRRAGTENVAGAIAMVTALKAREEELTIEKLSELKNIQVTFESWLRTEMPDVRVLGDEVPKLWNTTTVVMPDTDCRMRWVVKLDNKAIEQSVLAALKSEAE